MFCSHRIAIVSAALLVSGAGLAWAGFEPPQPGEKPPLKQPKGRASSGLKVGETAPAWSLKDSTGKTVALADLKGKVVLMDFWATWCGPCVAAMPTIQKIHEKYAKDGKVVVIGMNLDDAQKAAKHMAGNKFTYMLVTNAQPAASRYRVGPIPAMFIIGADGKVAHTAVGFNAGSAAQEEAELCRVIDEQIEAAVGKATKSEGKPADKPADAKPAESKPGSATPVDAPKPK